MGDIFSQKYVYGDGSNFFVFQNNEVRFSGFIYLIPKRSFPRSFAFRDGLGLSTLKMPKK